MTFNTDDIIDFIQFLSLEDIDLISIKVKQNFKQEILDSIELFETLTSNGYKLERYL